MERRLYERIRTDLPGSFYLGKREDGFKEFNGNVLDISEGGICISVSDRERNSSAYNIKLGDRISFQSLDEYVLYGHSRLDIVSGDVEVIRVEDRGANMKIGCRLIKNASGVREYLDNKRVSLMLYHQINYCRT